MAILNFVEAKGRLEEQEGGILAFDGPPNELIALIIQDALEAAWRESKQGNDLSDCP